MLPILVPTDSLIDYVRYVEYLKIRGFSKSFAVDYPATAELLWVQGEIY